ncbi:MAG TPA: hypothetical protein VK892_21505 [Pyrinomonadaceae bacterium]|nr:hypothetical protein [Pyrinomonadaceae bacterium]
MATNPEERIKEIKADILEIERQIKKLEFQHKKDIAALQKESEERWRRIEKQNEYVERHLKHLSQLAGVTFEELDAMDERLVSASAALSRKNRRSK